MPSDSLETVASRSGLKKFSSASTWYFSPMAGSSIEGRPYRARAGATAASRTSSAPAATWPARGRYTLRMFIFSAPDCRTLGSVLLAGSLGGTTRRPGADHGARKRPDPGVWGGFQRIAHVILDEMPSRGAGPSPTRRLLPYFARHRRTLAIGAGCILATTAIQLSSPWVLRYAVDDLYLGVTRGKLAYYAVVLFLISAAGGIFRFSMRRVIIGVSREMEYDLRNDFFGHLERMPPEYFRQRRTGDLMSRATNDLNAVRMMAGPSVMYATQTLLVFVVAIILMLSIDARLTLIGLLPLPLVSISVKLFGSAIHRRFERIQEQLAEMSAVAQENLSGVRVVRAYGQESAELEKFHRANEEYVSRNSGLIRLQGAFYPSMTLFLGFGALLVLWQGSRDVIQGRITVGQLVAFNAYLVMLSWPMIAFGWVTNMLQRGMASWKRMLEILDEPPAIADPAHPVSFDLALAKGRVEFRGLNYSYGDRLVLEGIDLRIEPGSTVAVVGPTGSGKTTLLQTLTRLLDTPPGTVFVDGVDVRDLPLTTLRRLVGVAPQEPFLFSDSLESNIAFAPEIAALSAEPRLAAVQRAASDSRL